MQFTSIDQLGPALAPSESPERLDSRAAFLRKLGLGAGVVVGGGLLLGRSGTAFAGHGPPDASVMDADILQYALTLEYLEASFYTQALGGQGTAGVPASSAKFSRGAINGSRLFKIFGGRIRSTAYGYLSAIRNHEVAHVNFLRAGLTAAGATPVPPATFNFSTGLGSVGAFLKTAQLLENTGVMAYDGAIRYIDTGDFLQAGAQIATVEARHAAYLNLINRSSPFPSAFDTGKKPSEILAAAKPFITRVPPEVDALFKRLP